MHRKQQYTITLRSGIIYGALFLIAGTASISRAQELPGPADSGRIDPMPPVFSTVPTEGNIVVPDISPDITIPEMARQVRFRLNAIKLENIRAFQEQELSDLYRHHINKEISLDVLWKIAEQITEHYRHKGYFLSRAYIPAQEIDEGIVQIRIIEGYIGKVEIDDEFKEEPVVQDIIRHITAQKPIDIKNLESYMLRLNDLPGADFRALLEPMSNTELQESVQLTLKPIDESEKASLQFNNFGSRFLGPYHGIATYEDSFLPMQRTTLVTMASIPIDELNYMGANHEIFLTPEWKINLSGGYVRAQPGARLEASDIESWSGEIGTAIVYQPVRQRDENMLFSLSFDGKNTNGDILENNPLTRDRIRAVRGKMYIDISDSWKGYNYLTINVNQGVQVLGSSREGDPYLSRAEAEPDFTSLNIHYMRQQRVTDDWMFIGQIASQLASAPLFSAEEFGVGGQQIGKAYDPSEITGDNGLSGGLEIRYAGFPAVQDVQFVPYMFYDIGKVWNEDQDGETNSLASAGLGLSLFHELGLSANIGAAWPLTRKIENPLYGDTDDPRLIIKLSYDF